MLLRRQLDSDRVASSDFAGGQDNTHDTGLADEVILLVAAQDRRHQVGLVVVQLPARVPQASHAYDCGITDVQPRSPWQGEQVNAARGDVLANRPGRNLKTIGTELVMQFLVNQVHLAEIWPGWVLGNARTVLDGHSQVGVALDPPTRLGAGCFSAPVC